MFLPFSMKPSLLWNWTKVWMEKLFSSTSSWPLLPSFLSFSFNSTSFRKGLVKHRFCRLEILIIVLESRKSDRQLKLQRLVPFLTAKMLTTTGYPRKHYAKLIVSSTPLLSLHNMLCYFILTFLQLINRQITKSSKIAEVDTETKRSLIWILVSMMTVKLAVLICYE